MNPVVINEVQKQRLNGVAYYACIAMSVLRGGGHRGEEHATCRRPAPELPGGGIWGGDDLRSS